MELVVSAGPQVAEALAPLVAVFGRRAGLGGRRARALARGIVALLRACGGRAASVRVRLQPLPRRLRVLVRLADGAAPLPRRALPALPGARVQRPGRRALVFVISGLSAMAQDRR